jgi:hypothetical protein
MSVLLTPFLGTAVDRIQQVAGETAGIVQAHGRQGVRAADEQVRDRGVHGQGDGGGALRCDR